ncbi:MAG: CocE/NonD family hydrolase [Chloroflexota bacterium]
MKRNIFSAAQYNIQSSNHYRIPTSSGVILGATIAQPANAPPHERFPAIVWYDPYRTGMDGLPNAMARYFAERGYAFVNLNVRGTGNSEGYSTDEYTEHETQDGADAIEWLAAQSWCNGNVGMLGASYSGFNTLQVAALAPPALKAIAPAYFTDRRYTDDCHYKGGCLRGYYDMLTYGLSMVAMNAMPPMRKAVGGEWSELWQARLEKSEPYLLKWLAHQVEDAYWAVGSIAGHYDDIKAASFLIGGWHDGYVNPPLRVFDALSAPKKLLMGPWSHSYPDQSHCGPRIDIHFELLRWWDHWLKGMDNGVMDEPAVQVYVQEHEEPITDRLHIAGAWRMADRLTEDAPQIYHLAQGQMQENADSVTGASSARYLPAACRNGGLWDAGVPFMLPGEQSTDSAHAINFTSPPLTDNLVIFGNPTFHLYISADVAVMPVAVRLLEVSPDGTSVLVTKGILNATRRNGMDNPEPLIPGEITQVEFHMEATAWRFTAGNQIQISINGSDFPNVWATPQAGRLTLHWGPDHPSRIKLPVWAGDNDPAFEYRPSPSDIRPTGSGAAPWRVIHDVLEDRYRVQMNRGNGEGEMGVSQRNPADAWITSVQSHQMNWPGLHVVSEAMGSMTSNETHFVMNLALNVTVNERSYFQKQWSETFERVLL